MQKPVIEPKEFWDDLHWGFDHYSELMEKYPDQWIAILHKKVLSSGDNLADVESDAERISKKSKDQIPVLFIECGLHVY